MGEIIRRNQQLPAEFAANLHALAAEVRSGGRGGKTEASARLNAVLMMARLQGWTLQALADAIGVTREAIRQRADRGRARADIPTVPMPPRRPTPMPQPPKNNRLLIRPEVAERLREMHAIARTVNGGTAADDPRRTVSVQFTEWLSKLVEQGVTVYRIAEELGVTHFAVRARLARHGYRNAPRSIAGIIYTGKPTHDTPKEECKRGHPLSGDNLYIAPKSGARICRECDRLRGRAYNARKRAAIEGGA
jgi:hypothetical protein